MAFLRLLCVVSLLASTELATAAVREPGEYLAQSYAQFRGSIVSDVQYRLDIDLTRGDKEFRGITDVGFALAAETNELTLDFFGGTIETLVVNGFTVKDVARNGAALALPGEYLRTGANIVRIVYIHPYAHDGSGLHRFVDPQNGETFVYTQFEAYYANRMFPSFDQPDLKARYELRVSAPKDWQVVTASRETAIRDEGAMRVWEFPASQAFSTYLISLHAGPFTVWEDTSGTIPIRLMARRSLAKHVNHEEWLALTRDGLRFFADYFDFPYPFGKYDQVIVPEFNAGAMENVGAVTFSERYISRGVETRAQRMSRANTLLHEMAHMWFGNLVTMEWWDDLWLNESFATYMGSLALERATEFQETWLEFFTSEKQWAYWEDGLVTTHPILADVPTTDHAFTNFDGITYGKGASVLKQVVYLIGAEGFRSGVQAYFRKHQYDNATLADFMKALELGSGKSLTAWSDMWLRTAGTNTLRPEFSCANGSVKNLRIVQTAPKDHPLLRAHKLVVGLYRKTDVGVVADATIAAQVSGVETAIPEAEGLPCPHLVYPNHEDHAFVRVALDPATLEEVPQLLSAIKDDLVRATFYETLWDMVHDGEYPVERYIQTVLPALKGETNLEIARTVRNSLVGRNPSASSALTYISRERDDRPNRAIVRQLADFMRSQLAASAPGSDWQTLWFEGYRQVAYEPAAQKELIAILAGKHPYQKLDVNQDVRWHTIAQLARAGNRQAETLRILEVRRDSSSWGENSSIIAQVAAPRLANKEKWFERIVSDDKMSFQQLRSAMSAMFPTTQMAVKAAFADRFYKRLPVIAKAKADVFLDNFAEMMIPTYCRPESAARLRGFLDGTDGTLSPILVKPLRVALQEDERCIQARKIARAEFVPTAARRGPGKIATTLPPKRVKGS